MIAKLLLSITNKLKPILVRIFPNKLLRSLKGKMILNSFDKLKAVTIIQYNQEKYPFGINLIGNIKAETGLGQSCRLLASELDSTEIPLSIYHYDQLGTMRNGDITWEGKLSNDLPYGINIIHINPHELGLAFMQLGQDVWNYRYNIGFWLWELEEFPDEWVPCFNILDEIWTPSEFISNAIRKKTDLPVKTIPYHVTVNINKEYRREYFALPKDKFLFLMMYDSGSIMERKNPIGVLQAFKKAFKREDNEVGLVIKINNYTVADEKNIRSILDGYTNVYFIKETLDKDQVNSLIKNVDVFISLHRAEGFGLVLAEAMLLGTPTIATNWSANTEFMNNEVACMIDAKLVKLQRDYGPFKKGNRWAEPNLEQVAENMKRMFENKDYRQLIAEKGIKFVEKKLNLENVTKSIIGNIEEIYRPKV